MNAVPRYLTMTLLASALQNLYAADNQAPQAVPDETVLTTIVVTATRTEKALDSLPPSVSVLNRKDMDADFIQDFSDLSTNEPGVTIARDPRYGLSSVNIRGLDGNRVLMLVDGIRVADAFAFGPYQNSGRDVVDFGQLQSVEIVRGPASSLYGSDALGGVVGMRTTEPADLLRGKDGFGGQAQAVYSSADNSLSARAGVAANVNQQTSWMLQISGQHGNALDNMGTNDSAGPDRTTPNPQTYDSASVLGKVQNKIEGGHKLGITAEYWQNKVDTQLDSNITSTILASRAEDNTERWRISADYSFVSPEMNGLIDAASLKIYYQDQTAEQNTYQVRKTASNWSRSSTFQQDQAGISGQAEKYLHGDTVMQTLLVGGEWLQSSLSQLRTGTPASALLDVRDVPNTDTTQLGLFIQDSIEWIGTGFTLVPGIRYDHYNLDPVEDAQFIKQGGTSVSLDDGKFSPKLLASWKASDTLSLFAQYSQGFRAPSPMELNASYVSPMGYAAVANPDLQPETSQGFEIGARLGDKALGGSVTVFDNHYKNFIEQVSINCPGKPQCIPGAYLVYQSQNIASVEIYGAEARAHWEPAQGWRGWMSLAYAVGINKTSDTYLDSVAPLQGVVGISYGTASWGGAFTLSAAATHDHVSSPDYFKAPGYGVLDFTAWWQPAKAVRLNAGVFNLGNKKYWLASDVIGVPADSTVVDRYSQPGTNARVNLVWNF